MTTDTLPEPRGADAQVAHALVIGASGGIGRAVAEAILQRKLARHLTVWTRSQSEWPPGVDVHTGVDITNERSIATAAASLGEVDLVFVATGLLHRPALDEHDKGVAPEKTWRALDAATLSEVFAINAIGPALVAKHVLPLLPRGRRAVFAAISARVGSIADNRLGGWYSYRASKAALNQIIRTLSIELKPRWPQAICVGLHPGTVDTGLSRPFHGSVDPTSLLTAEQSAERLLDVVLSLTPADSGRVFDHKGLMVPE